MNIFWISFVDVFSTFQFSHLTRENRFPKRPTSPFLFHQLQNFGLRKNWRFPGSCSWVSSQLLSFPPENCPPKGISRAGNSDIHQKFCVRFFFWRLSGSCFTFKFPQQRWHCPQKLFIFNNKPTINNQWLYFSPPDQRERQQRGDCRQDRQVQHLASKRPGKIYKREGGRKILLCDFFLLRPPENHFAPKKLAKLGGTPLPPLRMLNFCSSLWWL